MNASLSPKFRFGAESKSSESAFSVAGHQNGKEKVALTNAEFLRQSCREMRISMGPRDHAECPHRVTFDRLVASDNDALDECIAAAYRQVLGNAHIMAHERCDVLEAQLSDGRISTQEFIRKLAKSELYKSRYFYAVSAYRSIELNFKHLLGRPPLDQEEIATATAIQSEQGFDALIDSIIDSAEYTEVFGDSTVPYIRSYTSASGMTMANFTRIAALEQSFASSDRSKGSDSLLRSNFAAALPIKIVVPGVPGYAQVSMAWAGGKPPANYEKLWRGLALVGGAHLAGMMINVVSQISGNHMLDRVPAMFLGL